MEKRRVELKGLTTGEGQTDGEMNVLYNLKAAVGGGLVPCDVVEAVPQQIGLGTEAKAIFLHRMSEETIPIFVHEDGELLYVYQYEMDEDGTIHYPEQIATDEMLIAAVHEGVRDTGAFTAVEQVGNLLVIVFERDLYYALRKDGKYKELGFFPELPELMMRPGKTHRTAAAELPEGGGWITLTEGQLNAMGAVVVGSTDEDTTQDVFLNRVYETFEGLIAKIKLETQEAKGRACFFDPVSIRYAFRLYDGRITRPSVPLLMMPQEFIEEFYEPLMAPLLAVAEGSSKIYLLPPSVGYYFVEVVLPNLTPYVRWSDIITGIDIFCSEPIDMREGEVSLGMRMYIGGTYVSVGNFGSSGRPARGYYDRRADEVTQRRAPLGDIRDESARAAQGEPVETKVVNASQFYLLQHIDLRHDVGKESGRYVMEGETGLLELPNSESLVYRETDIRYQELMDEAALSHHRYGGQVARVMNGQLRLADVTCKLFGGFGRLFLWDHDEERRPYNGTIPKDLYPDFTKLVIEVELAVGNETRKVYSEELAISSADGISLLPLFSYPDRRAQHFTLYAYSVKEEQWYEILNRPLTAHPTLELAYYLETEAIYDREGGTTKPTKRNNGTGHGRR